MPATITNWGGDEVVVTQEVLAHLKELSGVEAKIKVRFVEGAPKGNNNDNTVRRSITGPCKVKFRDAYVELYKTAIALPSGAVSEPQAAPDGVHILRIVTNRMPVMQSFEEARQKVFFNYKKAEQTKLEEADTRYLRAKADIQIAKEFR